MTFEPVIGLEVHAQLLTRSKLFCGCSAEFGAPPNSHTCPGLHGVSRRAAGDSTARASSSRSAPASRPARRIAPTSRFARKNYFYPDLPKAYQISMYDAPICIGGAVRFVLDGEEKRMRLTRIHLEEDAGKNIHDAHADASLVDLNRAGVPLLEIVSEPDLRSPAEAAAYLRALRSILQYLEVCDGNMEEGSLRCDANISCARRGATDARHARRGQEHELVPRRRACARARDRAPDRGRLGRRRRSCRRRGCGTPSASVTRSMRSKEFAHDYRYFPEPDLPPLVVGREWVEDVRRGLPELPARAPPRFERELGLPAYDAEVLTARRDVADYFEAALARHRNPKALSNWVMESVLRIVREQKLDERLRITAWPVAPEHLAALVALIDDGTISGKIAKTVFEEMVATGKPPAAIVAERGLVQVTDRGAIDAAVERVLAAHPDKVAEYRAGKDKLFGFFVGQVMKATDGKANPKQVNEILRKRLRE